MCSSSLLIKGSSAFMHLCCHLVVITVKNSWWTLSGIRSQTSWRLRILYKGSKSGSIHSVLLSDDLFCQKSFDQLSQKNRSTFFFTWGKAVNLKVTVTFFRKKKINQERESEDSQKLRWMSVSYQSVLFFFSFETVFRFYFVVAVKKYKCGKVVTDTENWFQAANSENLKK